MCGVDSVNTSSVYVSITTIINRQMNKDPNVTMKKKMHIVSIDTTRVRWTINELFCEFITNLTGIGNIVNNHDPERARKYQRKISKAVVAESMLRYTNVLNSQTVEHNGYSVSVFLTFSH